MSILARATVAAAVVESTEGTPVAVSSGDEFVALRPGFTIAFSTEELTNDTLKNSLAPSKSIRGVEAPSASLDSYLKASGAEGTKPEVWELLKSAFGSEHLIATERDTVGGSTATVLEVDTGEGAEFARGDLVLVKDSANGFAVRPVLSVSGDSLTLGFALSAAPASGVNLGRSLTLSPANTGHQTYSLWEYVGNGGAVKLMAGARTISADVTANAGELIELSVGMEGISQYFNPIEITASDTYLDFTDDAGTFAVQVEAKMYASPHELASAIQTAMLAASSETHAVVYSDALGTFTISTSTSTVLSLLWNTGGNAANTVGDKIGFSVAADDTGSTSYVSDSAFSDLQPSVTPTYDSSDALAAKSNQLFIGDQDDAVCVEASAFSMSFGTPKSNINSICSDSGVSGSIVSERTTEYTVSAKLSQYEAEKFERFRTNQDTSIMYVGGEKSGGNWVGGKVFMVYSPTAVISDYTTEEIDGVVFATFTLTTFSDNQGNGETYIAFG